MGKPLTDDEVIAYLPKIGEISPTELKARLGTATVGVRLKKLADEGKVERHFRDGKRIYYSRIKNV